MPRIRTRRLTAAGRSPARDGPTDGGWIAVRSSALWPRRREWRRSAAWRSAPCWPRPVPPTPVGTKGSTSRKNLPAPSVFGRRRSKSLMGRIGQEPDYASPINSGSHAESGAAVRADARASNAACAIVDEAGGRPRTRIVLGYPPSTSIWRQVAGIRRRARTKSIAGRPSSRTKRPLLRTAGAFWGGTNNSDHRRGICQSTTVPA